MAVRSQKAAPGQTRRRSGEVQTRLFPNATGCKARCPDHPGPDLIMFSDRSWKLRLPPVAYKHCRTRTESTWKVARLKQGYAAA